MIGHKPECPANWGVGEMPEGPCTFCEMLSACEQRVWKDPLLLVSRRAGWNDALIAAREAVAALPAQYKTRGDFDTYGPYNEGRMDMKDSALAAIDALRKEKP